MKIKFDVFLTPNTSFTYSKSFMEKPPFYELKRIFKKNHCTWRDFKNIFSRPREVLVIQLSESRKQLSKASGIITQQE